MDGKNGVDVRNSVLSAIETLINSKSYSYDKTFIGRIVTIKSNDIYDIKINGKIYKNIKGIPFLKFKENEMVYCLAPGGNLNQLKIILPLDKSIDILINNIIGSHLSLKGSFEALTDINGFSISDMINVGLELGRRDGTSGTPYIDFHTDGDSNTDYNVRLIAANNYLNVNADGGLKVNNNNVITVTSSSFGINGYVKFSNGLIIQWGTFNASRDTTDSQINLNVSFTNSNYYIGLQLGVGTYNDYMNGSGINSKTASSFNYSTRYDAVTVSWLAVGY